MTHARRFTAPFLMLMLLLVAIVGPVSGVAATTMFWDPDGAYSVALPVGWQPAETESGNIGFASRAIGAAFVIAATPANGQSLDDAAAATMADFANEPGYLASPAGMQDLIVGGAPAKGCSYRSYDDDGSLISTAAVMVLNNDTMYLLTFVTTPDREGATQPAIAAILSSWRFS